MLKIGEIMFDWVKVSRKIFRENRRIFSKFKNYKRFRLSVEDAYLSIIKNEMGVSSPCDFSDIYILLENYTEEKLKEDLINWFGCKVKIRNRFALVGQIGKGGWLK